MNGKTRKRGKHMLKNIGKRLLVFVLAIAMTAGFMPVQLVYAYQEVTISNLRWDGNIARWDVNGNASKYKVRLINDTSGTGVTYETTDTFYDFSDFFVPGNQYCFTVSAYIGDVDVTHNGPGPMKKMEGSIGNISIISDPNTRVARWAEVSGAESYLAYIFEGDTQLYPMPVACYKTVYDFSKVCLTFGSGSYSVKVVAVDKRNFNVLAEGRSKAVEVDPFAPVTISYDPNGGTGSMDSINMDVGETYTYPNSCGFTAPFGREFLRWEDHLGVTHDPGATMTLYAGVVVKPVWRNVTAYVDYDANRILSGVVGKATAANVTEAEQKTQYINVYFEGLSLSERGDASAIRITNLPAGMVQSTHWIDGTNTARICVYGTPTAASTDQVQLEIGKTATTFGGVIIPKATSATRFLITEGEQVKNVSLTAGLPSKLYAGGKLPKYMECSCPDDVDYAIGRFSWHKADGSEISTGESLTDGTALEVGDIYYAEFEVVCNDGCFFAPESSLHCYINNSGKDVTKTCDNNVVYIKKTYAVQSSTNARYTIKYVDPTDENNTWTDDVNGLGTSYTLTNNLTAPIGKELNRWSLMKGSSAPYDSTTEFLPKDSEINVYSDLVFKADWKDRNYTVHFATAEGTGTMTDVTTGMTYELPECEFIPNAGRKFYKWNYDGAFYNPGDTITIKDGYSQKVEEITLRAVWQSSAENTVGTITVKNVIPPVEGQIPNNANTYELLAGEHTHFATVEEISHALGGVSQSVAQDYYSNQGWYKGVWDSTYSEYRYNFRYGKGTTEPSWLAGTPFAVNGKYMLMLYVAPDEGYHITDCSVTPENLAIDVDYDTADAAIREFTDGIRVLEIYFTAKPANMAFTLKNGGGTGDDQIINVPTNTEYPIPECTFKAPEGKLFDSWKTADNISYKPGDKVIAKNDMTLTAVWAPDTRPFYAITLTDDGFGTATANVTEARKGTEITLTPTPNEGRTFKGWYVVSVGDGTELQITDNKFTMPDGEVEIMAIFHDHDFKEVVDPKYLKYPAGCVGKAVYYKSCSVCGMISDETFEYGEALGHKWVDPNGVETKAPSCTEYGEKTFTCSRCGAVVTNDINPLGHDWKDATYVWAEDNSTVTATRICKRNENHKETETVAAKLVSNTATADKAGIATYEAVFENPAFEKQTKEVQMAATGSGTSNTGGGGGSSSGGGGGGGSTGGGGGGGSVVDKPAVSDNSTKPPVAVSDNTVKTPEKGDTVAVKTETGDKTGAIYTVTDAAKKEVSFSLPEGTNVKNLTIPATVTAEDGTVYTVTEIPAGAFKGVTGLKKIIIGSNITKIDEHAFDGCEKVKVITVDATNLKTVDKNSLNGVNKKAKIVIKAKDKKTYKKLVKKFKKAGAKKATYKFKKIKTKKNKK